jgi:hypothetical protein
MWLDILYLVVAGGIVYWLYKKFGTGASLEEVDPEAVQEEEEVKKEPHRKGWKKEKRKE